MKIADLGGSSLAEGESTEIYVARRRRGIRAKVRESRDSHLSVLVSVLGHC